jgi:GntR family galactonate operon transcriptional repressor
MTVKKSTRGQVAAVVDILGRRIAAGDYAEGETLPVEQDLADSLEVGRNALREAVKVLSGKGLISTAPRSGTRIRQREDWNMLDPDVLRWHADPDIATEQFMLDLIEMRRIVEPKAAELAAARATREDIASIMSAVDAMAASEHDLDGRIEADMAFHSAILKASHNAVLNHFRYAVATYLKAHSRLGQEVSDTDSKADLARHQQIAWAIASGKAKSAHSLTVAMLNMNRSHFAGR